MKKNDGEKTGGILSFPFYKVRIKPVLVYSRDWFFENAEIFQEKKFLLPFQTVPMSSVDESGLNKSQRLRFRFFRTWEVEKGKEKFYQGEKPEFIEN